MMRFMNTTDKGGDMHMGTGLGTIGRGIAAVLFLAAWSSTSNATSFTAGNIVVYRVGDGVGALVQTGNPVFLDEYTPAGTPTGVTVALPTTVSGSNQPLVAQGGTGNGSAIEGMISTSTDGQYIVLTGYDTTLPGSGTLSGTDCSTVARTVGVVKYDGTVDTTTALTDFACKTNVRSAASTNGTDLWVSGNQGTGTLATNGGAHYAARGATTSTQLNGTDTNMRQLTIFGNQLYGAVNSAAVTAIGSPPPPTTAGQTDTTLTLPGSGTSPDGLFFASLPGGTVLYVTDDTAGLIYKWSLVSGTWTANGTITLANARAIFGTVSGSTVTLYVRDSTTPTVIQKLTDSSGYNATITGTLATWITAGANETFRGIAGAPHSAATPTATATPTNTPPGATHTSTHTPTVTITPTITLTPTPTSTPTPTPSAAAFTSGNIVVYRVGRGGSDTLASTGNAVFLDEFTTSGTLVQSVGLPTTASGGSNPLVASGVAASEGQLDRSVDKQYLLLTGYDSTLPAASSLASSAAATVPRVIGRVKGDGSIDTTTALTDFSDGDNPRSATSADGTNLYGVGNSGGVRYATLGSTTSTQINMDSVNNRYVTLFDGQLYISSQKAPAEGVDTVGTGEPTMSGATATVLTGFPALGKPEAFVLADLSGGTVLYVADDTAGIQKFSLVSGTWTANGTAGTGTDLYNGLTASVSGDTVTLYTTRKGSELAQLVDGTGFNMTLTGTPSLIATAAAGTAFRGVALAPEGGGKIPPDKASGKCEDKVFKNLSKLASCDLKCQSKEADALEGGKTFDVPTCKGSSGCLGKYDGGNAKLVLCPGCLGTSQQDGLAGAVTSFLTTQDANIYCGGTMPLGGSDPGNIPTSDIKKCEDGEAKALSKFGACTVKCLIKQADADFKVKTFDEPGCETACLGAYNTTVSTKLTGCPACLGGTATADLASALTNQLHSNDGSVYCSGTQPLH